MEDLLTSFIDERQFLNITISQLVITLATIWYANIHTIATSFDKKLMSQLRTTYTDVTQGSDPKCLNIEGSSDGILIWVMII